jgi:hypothetical protein
MATSYIYVYDLTQLFNLTFWIEYEPSKQLAFKEEEEEEEEDV